MRKQGRAKLPKPPAKRMKRYARKQEIVRRLIYIIPTHGRPWLTTYEIASLIGMARSSNLQSILDEMCASGTLRSRKVQRPNRRPGVEYRLREHYAQPKHEGKPVERLITINGVQYERMSML